jgi:hypothetical protein
MNAWLGRAQFTPSNDHGFSVGPVACHTKLNYEGFQWTSMMSVRSSADNPSVE